MRQFLRHPVAVPVELHIEQDAAWGANACRTRDISAGGLALHVAQPVLPGRQVALSIDYLAPRLEAQARVAWCRPADTADEGYALGLSFVEDVELGLLAQMVEQLCQIEDYRFATLRSSGRRLSHEEAANEWLAQYTGPALH
ncbi:PilZ domain-containing protein [Paucibacter soli]|uniref:PilZ domain-containing protein n=1 Tax=Paucibacter soli TaxID=3133433 RepID=UPI00309FADD7